jgi:hypothetical protein
VKRLYIFCLLLSFFACEREYLRTEVILRIKENKTSCTGFEGQTECYLIQQGKNMNSDTWEYFYDQIKGFEYEPGFVHKLLVAKEPVKNPPMDASSIRYILIKELSKEPK